MHFLRTMAGLIGARYVCRIGKLNARSTGNNYHEIDFCVGTEPRETRATEEDVQDFLEESQQ